MDLEKYSLAELKAILEEIPRELARRERVEKSAVWQDMEKVAAKQGYSLKRLFDEVEAQLQSLPKR